MCVQFWRAGAAAPPLPAAVQRRVRSSHPQTLPVPAEEDQNSTGGISFALLLLFPTSTGSFVKSGVERR